ncbi:MAG: ABC transporter permease [Myxococcota bacterium]|nr:ABC transporter permease [Myxococcota bacterium]
MDTLSGVWSAIEALGGGLSLAFIVAVAIALMIVAVVYMSAAFVVLGRFARGAKRPRVVAPAAAILCGFFAWLGLGFFHPQLAAASWGAWARVYLPVFVGLLGFSAFFMALYRGALGRTVFPRLLLTVLLPALAGLAFSFLEVPAGGMERQEAALGGVALGILLGLLPLAVAGLIEMRSRAEWFIATRYLVAERRQVFISAITLICVGAVASGVWLIITVLSVMNGFERTWRDEIVGNYAHFLVRSYYGEVLEPAATLAKIESVEGVVAASPFVEAEGMVRKPKGGIAPVRLRGIDPVKARQVTRLDERVLEGSLDDLGIRDSAQEAEDPGLMIGNALAESLDVGLGDTLILISPHGGRPTPLGPSPRLVRFEVRGIFESSFLQFDELYAYADIPAVLAFLGREEGVSGFEVRTVDFFRSRRVADAVEIELGHPFFGRDWKELFPGFFHALQDNRSLMFMLLIMIMVVSAFVIVVTLMMMIMAKSRDVAILKTMGARDQSIELIFAIEGTLIGIVGVAVGVLAGIAVSTQLAWIQGRIEEVTGIDTLPASVYQVSSLPSEVDPLQVFGVVSIALILSLGATLLPSRHGARLDPVEALRED